MKTEAYGNGWVACSMGVDMGDNPYAVDTQTVSYSEWNEGWGASFSMKNENGWVDPDEWRKA